MTSNTFALFLVLVVALLAGCVGPAKRGLQSVTLDAWEEVRADVERGVADGDTDGELNADERAGLSRTITDLTVALHSEEIQPGDLVALWAALKPWAERGIADRVDDGEIGAGVAESFRERLTQFDAAIVTLE